MDRGDRSGAERAVQIAVKCNEYLDTLDEVMHQLIRDRHSSTARVNITGESSTMLICAAIKIVRQKLAFEMETQDMRPRVQLPYALISTALGCVSCSLLLCVLLHDMPWPIFLVCILILVIPFELITN